MKKIENPKETDTFSILKPSLSKGKMSVSISEMES
jgi:hypothetical protein